MIHKIAKMIADYLFKNEIIKEEDEDIYIYGYEILISSIISLTMITILGITLHQILNSVIFYTVFVITRLYSGGYHANSYFKCNILFVIIYLCTLVISKLMYGYISFIYLLIFLAIYIGCILEYAPMDNKNKTLTIEEKKRNRKISIWISFCWTVLACILYFFAKEYALTLTITLVMIAMLMVIEINRRRELALYEQEKDFRSSC